MQSQTGKRKRTDSTRILSLSAAIMLLLFLSALIVACGGTGGTADSTTGLTSSAATTTIHLGDHNTVIVPTQAPYTCVTWATQTSPAINSTTVVGIYAKFIHNVDGNPEGVEGATATARVDWGTGNIPALQAQAPTTKDGLAVFRVDFTQITNPPLNKEIIVTVNFSKDGQSCTTANTPAYFTLIMVSPTADNGTPTDMTTPTCTPKKKKKQQC